MLFWTKLFGRSASVPPSSHIEVSSEQRQRSQATLSSETSKQVILDALHRLETAGLRIYPKLDRDLIVVRCLCDLGHRHGFDELAKSLSTATSDGAPFSIDLMTLGALARDTDVFDDFEEIEAILPKLSSLSDEALSSTLDAHSYSIFENATEICIVNEDGPEFYAGNRAGWLCNLACGDFEIKAVDTSQKAERLLGRVTLTDGRSVSFEFSAEKRPDLTPFFRSMNSLVEPQGLGRFVSVAAESDESLIAVYLRPSEFFSFRAWAERQDDGFGAGSVEWFE